jgi:hypothetical protein
MANFRYFVDLAGGTLQLDGIANNGAGRGAAAFTGATPEGRRVTATRMIEYKRNASKHECDARCVNATGRIMKCECSCGGKNHGKGSLSCQAVAA